MYCITREEFEMSKAIFLVYIQSLVVKTVLGLLESEELVEFVQAYIFPHGPCLCASLDGKPHAVSNNTYCVHL